MHSGRRMSLLAGALGIALVLGVTGHSYPVRAQTSGVAIVDYAFSPPSLTVPAGSTVTWTNQGRQPHTVTDDSGNFGSSTLNSGQSYSYTFAQGGTFTYHCLIHSYMEGTIVVQQAGGTSTAVATQVATATPVPTSTTVAPATPVVLPTATDTPSPAPTSPPAKGGKRKTITAGEVNNRYVFAPTRISVAAGTRVVWKNSSNAPHTVTSSSRAWKYNKPLSVRGSLSVVFKRSGTFRYYCRFHPGMRGTIVVKR